MSEDLNRDFSEYEAMETEKLEEILRLDAEAPAGAESDTELLLYILEVLASRRNTKSITGNTAQKAWESFEQNYMPEKPHGSVAGKKSAPWLRRLTAAAAVLVLLITIPFTTRAFTLEEVLDFVARWAKETFSFVSSGDTDVKEPSPDDTDGYSSLQKLLEENNRDSTIVPTWIPDRFVLNSVKKDITPVQETYYAQYTNGEYVFFIYIQNYLNSDSLKIEINQDYSEIYSTGVQDYYIFNNNKQNQVIWICDSYECTISGNLSIDEIKLMIDSIQKG